MSKKNKQHHNDLSSMEQEHMRLEKDNVSQSNPSVPEEPKVDFDAWYALRRSKIPAHHYKEIIKADFNGRNVPNLATIAEFDAALEKYGIKLN